MTTNAPLPSSTAIFLGRPRDSNLPNYERALAYFINNHLPSAGFTATTLEEFAENFNKNALRQKIRRLTNNKTSWATVFVLAYAVDSYLPHASSEADKALLLKIQQSLQSLWRLENIATHVTQLFDALEALIEIPPTKLNSIAFDQRAFSLAYFFLMTQEKFHQLSGLKWAASSAAARAKGVNLRAVSQRVKQLSHLLFIKYQQKKLRLQIQQELTFQQDLTQSPAHTTQKLLQSHADKLAIADPKTTPLAQLLQPHSPSAEQPKIDIETFQQAFFKLYPSASKLDTVLNRLEIPDDEKAQWQLSRRAHWSSRNSTIDFLLIHIVAPPFTVSYDLLNNLSKQHLVHITQYHTVRTTLIELQDKFDALIACLSHKGLCQFEVLLARLASNYDTELNLTQLRGVILGYKHQLLIRHQKIYQAIILITEIADSLNAVPLRFHCDTLYSQSTALLLMRQLAAACDLPPITPSPALPQLKKALHRLIKEEKQTADNIEKMHHFHFQQKEIDSLKQTVIRLESITSFSSLFHQILLWCCKDYKNAYQAIKITLADAGNNLSNAQQTIQRITKAKNTYYQRACFQRKGFFSSMKRSSLNPVKLSAASSQQTPEPAKRAAIPHRVI